MIFTFTYLMLQLGKHQKPNEVALRQGGGRGVSSAYGILHALSFTPLPRTNFRLTTRLILPCARSEGEAS